VVQLIDDSKNLLAELNRVALSPDKIKVVKAAELKSIMKSLNKYPEITAMSINTKLNKVDVYLSEKANTKLKSDIVSQFSDDAMMYNSSLVTTELLAGKQITEKYRYTLDKPGKYKAVAKAVFYINNDSEKKSIITNEVSFEVK
jgi:hypothetical protein